MQPQKLENGPIWAQKRAPSFPGDLGRGLGEKLAEAPPLRAGLEVLDRPPVHPCRRPRRPGFEGSGPGGSEARSRAFYSIKRKMAGRGSDRDFLDLRPRVRARTLRNSVGTG